MDVVRRVGRVREACEHGAVSQSVSQFFPNLHTMHSVWGSGTYLEHRLYLGQPGFFLAAGTVLMPQDTGPKERLIGALVEQ